MFTTEPGSHVTMFTVDSKSARTRSLRPAVAVRHRRRTGECRDPIAGRRAGSGRWRSCPATWSPWARFTVATTR